MKMVLSQLLRSCLVLSGVVLLETGCQTSTNSSPPQAATPAPAAAVATPAATTVASMAVAQPLTKGPFRIKAGSATSLTDSAGNVWLADQGFADGDTVERPDIQIENATDPKIYQSEHYGMTSFSMPVANGKYTVKLHFAETFEGIEGPGQRVFSYSAPGHEVKDFDIWAKTGGARRAYVDTFDVEVTNGKLEIKFISNIENPEINGIEIIPQS